MLLHIHPSVLILEEQIFSSSGLQRTKPCFQAQLALARSLPTRLGHVLFRYPFLQDIQLHLWHFLLFFFLNNPPLPQRKIIVFQSSCVMKTAIVLPGDLHDTAVSFGNTFSFLQKHTVLQYYGSVCQYFHALISLYSKIHLCWIINLSDLTSFHLPNPRAQSRQSPSCLHVPIQTVTLSRYPLTSHWKWTWRNASHLGSQFMRMLNSRAICQVIILD